MPDRVSLPYDQAVDGAETDVGVFGKVFDGERAIHPVVDDAFLRAGRKRYDGKAEIADVVPGPLLNRRVAHACCSTRWQSSAATTTGFSSIAGARHLLLRHMRTTCDVRLRPAVVSPFVFDSERST